MYELTDPDAVAALIDAPRRSVDVKVILDAAFHGQAINTGALRAVARRRGGRQMGPSDVIYHQKTITVDDRAAAVGTGNLTHRYYATSRDAYVITTNPADVAAITATFDTDFTAPPSGRPPAATPSPRLVWSPDARAVFLQRIDSAVRTLEITSEELNDRAAVVAIDKAARRRRSPAESC